MLSTTELIALLEDLESDRVERTTSVNNTDKFCQAICAFSNDFPGHNNPGYLIIGANDRGDLNGLTITDRLLTNLADIRSSGNILPLPALTIQKYSFPEGELAVVEVFPSDIPPVRYKGRVYIRTGPSKSIASETEERILSERRTAQTYTFDVLPCEESALKNINLELFKLSYLPQAIGNEILELKEEIVAEYPLPAIREFLMNAVMHRDYRSNAPIRFYMFSDHIEIQNPGGLYGSARPENFPDQNDYRNPVIAEALKILGYVNKFSRGVYRSQKLLQENGNPAAEFTLDQPAYLAVKIKKRLS